MKETRYLLLSRCVLYIQLNLKPILEIGVINTFEVTGEAPEGQGKRLGAVRTGGRPGLDIRPVWMGREMAPDIPPFFFEVEHHYLAQNFLNHAILSFHFPVFPGLTILLL